MADRKQGIPRTRRQFCSDGCRIASVAALGGALASLLEGCAATTPSSPLANVHALPRVSAPEENGAIVVTIDAASPLAAVGGAALVTSASGTIVLVARTAEPTFVALTALCTHQACVVANISDQTYVCPCHGSQFSFDGKVLTGPALRALGPYATTFSGDVLTITA